MKKIFTTILLSVFALAIIAQTDIIPPQLNTPDDGDDQQMPDVVLDWYATAGSGVITYTLEIDLDVNFTAPVVYTMETSSATMDKLNFGDTYYWRVKASDGTGDESAWSDVFSFIVIKRFDINKPDDGDENAPPNEAIKWKKSYSGTTLSGISHIDCQIDTSYFWKNTNQTITDDVFLGVSSIDGKSWAVGEGGIVLYFDGTMWTEQDPGTSDDLFAVDFVDENNGWAVGEGGTIVFYNGTEWAEQTSSTSDDLFAVDFVDANNGWAVGEGGTVVYFNGTEWAEQTSTTNDDLFGVSFVDANAGWAVGDGGTIVAFNGTEWDEQSNPSTKDLFGVSFFDVNNGWAAGKSGAIVYYNGTEWTEQESSTSNDLNFVTAISVNEVWTGGEDGRLTQYDGTEWLEVAGASIEILNDCSIFGNDFGFIVGENGTIVAKNADAFNSPNNILSTHADSSALLLSELYFGTDYFFRIRGRHSEDMSSWSSVRYFTTIDKPVNLAPSNGATDQMLDVIVSWNEVPGTYEYIYELCNDPEFSYSCTGYSDSNSFKPQGIVFGETYYWHIKARHTADTTEWSNTWSFTVLDQMTHISPANGSFVTDIFPTLEWEEATGVNGYYISYADNENFDGAHIEKITDSEVTNFIVPEVLDDGETYYWQVRAYIAGDTTQWSTPWSFTMGSASVNEFLSENNINIYPNPTQGLLYVELKAAKQTQMQIEVSNLLGEVLIREDYTAQQGINTHSINLEKFGAGVYLIQMQSGNEVFTQRVLIDK